MTNWKKEKGRNTALGRSRKTKAPLFGIARGVWTTFISFCLKKKINQHKIVWSQIIKKRLKQFNNIPIRAFHELHPWFCTIIFKTHTHTPFFHLFHILVCLCLSWRRSRLESVQSCQDSAVCKYFSLSMATCYLPHTNH